MKVYHGLNEYHEPVYRPVVTLGNFDGAHLGHRKIFELLKLEARKDQGTPLVITFFPHPLKIINPEKAPRLISSFEERLLLIKSCGIEYVACIPFTKDFAAWSPERFVQEILINKLGVKKVLVGEDFRFGKGRKAGLNFLRQSGKAHGFHVHRIAPVQINDQEVSSTRIRQAIQKGQVLKASKMLDRPYRINGSVVHGEKRGRTIGFPTANLDTNAELIPANGVYAVKATIEDIKFSGVANLGVKPTFSGKQFTIEINIFNFDNDIYGKSLQVDFIERIREERPFPNVQALIQQIQQDCNKAREILQDSPEEYKSVYEEKIRVLSR